VGLHLSSPRWRHLLGALLQVATESRMRTHIATQLKVDLADIVEVSVARQDRVGTLELDERGPVFPFVIEFETATNPRASLVCERVRVDRNIWRIGRR